MRYRVSEIMSAIAGEDPGSLRATHALAVARDLRRCTTWTIADVLRAWPTWIRRALGLATGTIDIAGRIPRVSDDEVCRTLVAEAQRLGVPLRACHEDAGDEPGAAGW